MKRSARQPLHVILSVLKAFILWSTCSWWFRTARLFEFTMSFVCCHPSLLFISIHKETNLFHLSYFYNLKSRLDLKHMFMDCQRKLETFSLPAHDHTTMQIQINCCWWLNSITWQKKISFGIFKYISSEFQNGGYFSALFKQFCFLLSSVKCPVTV